MIQRLRMAVAATVIGLGVTPSSADALMIAVNPSPSVLVAEADVVAMGKIIEIEKDQVEVSPFRGAPKEQKQAYRIAVLKIDDALIGGQGLTQIRIGFPPEGAPGGGGFGGVKGGGIRPAIARPGRPIVALTKDQEGCFFLTPHHEGDFYVMSGFGGPLNKKDEGYDKKIAEVKNMAKIIDEPVKALKAKELDARYTAAELLLRRYQRYPVASVKPGQAPKREPIPAEENDLIVSLLTELPWAPKQDGKPRTGQDLQPPSRMALWNMIYPHELGYKQPTFPPQRPGDAPIDYNKIQDESTTKFLAANKGKIKIKRFVTN